MNPDENNYDPKEDEPIAIIDDGTVDLPDSNKTVISNATGLNATALSNRRQEFDQDKLETVVTIEKGGTYSNKLASELSKQMNSDESIELTKENLNFLTSFSSKMKDGYQAAVPLVCLGERKCPYAKSCPLVQQSVELKIGGPCPVETHLFSTWTESKYKELGIDPDSDDFGVDRSQVREHAELEILQYRATLEMAETPLTVVEKVIGIDDAGQPIVTEVENPRIGVISRLSTIKRNLLTDLVATRKARLAAGQKGESAMDTVSRLAARGKERQEKLEKERLERIENERDVEAEVIDDETPKETPDF